MLQQMESVYPAFLVQGELLTELGTLLSPYSPAEKQREHMARSRRQQMA